MNPALTKARPRYIVDAPSFEMLFGVTALLIISACAMLALYRLGPPPAAGASAPPSEFSSARAFKHLEAIAARPRPIGSVAHTAARDYLVGQLSALGLAPEVQKVSGVNRMTGTMLNAATVENVLGRLKGTVGDRAVLLVCHYDSVPTGPGASDDGSAVGALLETARALKAQPPLNNDIIFLFTDAEETGLLGAKAFVDEHVWAKDVAVILNFEARGHTGQSIMFETSPNNRWLIAQFAAATQYPVANSLSYEVYKRLPNDTDFTIFKERGFKGLNFAYLEGFTHYHTSLDNLQNVDRDTLQHQGTYALGLATHFGNLDLIREQNLKDGSSNAVYFNVFGFWFVQYSGRWVLPLMLVTLLLLAGVIYLGRRSRQLTLLGTTAGSFAFLAALVATPLLLWFVWWLFRLLQKSLGKNIQVVAYHQSLCLLGLVALSIAITSAVFILLRRRVSKFDMVIGALLWWAIAATFISLALPGMSYLFVWPLMFVLIALAFLFHANRWERSQALPFVLLTLSALPGIILLTPTIYLLFIAMSFSALIVVAVLVVMLVGLLTPQLRILATTQRWSLPAIAGVAGLVLLTFGSLAPGFDDGHPQSDNLFFALDADTNQAIWAGADDTPDEWTARYLTGGRRGAISEYVPWKFTNFLSQSAPALPLSPPNIQLISETTTDEMRSLKLRVTSPRQAQVITVYLDPDIRVYGGSVNGKLLDDGGPKVRQDPGNSPSQWRLNYYAPQPEGLELTLRVKPSLPIKIHVMDRSYGLPDIPGGALALRPNWSMPAAFLLYSDETLVGKSFTF